MTLVKNLPLIKAESGKRKIVVIRHGSTLMNDATDERIRGWLDLPLDPKGFEEAERLGKKLKDSGIDMLVSSDLTRTLQTANLISIESGIPILATSMALRPWNVGKYTGQPAAEVHPILFKMAQEEPDEPIKDGESFNSFKFRVLMGIVAFCNEYKGKLIGFVAHHRNDRIVRGWYEAGCPDDLEIDFEHFGQRGILPGTADIIEIKSKLLI